MPFLTIQNTPNGPILDFTLCISVPRRNAMIAAGMTPPNPVSVRGLIDTGASSTCIDPSIIKQLGLIPTGTIQISTPSTGENAHTCNQYDASFQIVHPSLNYLITAMPIIESQLSHQGIQALVGRDVLCHCLFVYDGISQFYTLAF